MTSVLSRHFRRFCAFLLGSFVLSEKIFAAGYDLTDPNFTISVDELNPLGSGGGASAKSGQEALHAIITNISDILLMSIPLIAGIALIIAGYFFIFSGGDSEKISKGKTIIKWNLIAIFVAFLSYALVSIIANFFS